MKTSKFILFVFIPALTVLLTHIFIGKHSFLFDFLIAFLIILLVENLLKRFKSSAS